jgi:hypothetical protein
MTRNKRFQVQSRVVFIMNEHFNNYNAIIRDGLVKTSRSVRHVHVVSRTVQVYTETSR